MLATQAEKHGLELDSTRSRTVLVAGLAALLITYFVVWLASRPYEGITYDAQLYTLQALATLRSEPLSHDIFLRFGSQNSFTAFPHMMAPLIGWFGAEPAAAIATVSSALLLLGAGWWLARTLSDARLAWLSLGLLTTVHGWYGAIGVFRYDEMYLSARVPAEAWSILALCFACRARLAWAAACGAIAMAIHPVMSAPTIGVLALMALDSRWGDGRHRTVTALAIAGAALVVVLSAVTAPEMTAARRVWLDTLHQRSSYVFVQYWPVQDWLSTALGIATLAIGCRLPISAAARRAVYCTLLVGILGLVFATLGALGERFELLLLAQAWRWTWLTRFVAVALLPLILGNLWKGGDADRATALLLGSGWALFEFSGGALALVAALLCWSRARIGTTTARTILRGAYAISACAALLLGAQAMIVLQLNFDTNMGPIWVQRMIDVMTFPGPAVLLVAAVWYWTIMRPSVSRIGLVAAAAAVALVGLIPYSHARVSDSFYSEAKRAQFTSWRDRIPLSAEVLWHEDPAAVWTLLERKSFLSISQSAGLLYSPEATQEFLRRSDALAPLADPGWWTMAKRGDASRPKVLTLPILARICQEPSLSYVVSARRLEGYVDRAEWPTTRQYVFLYDCATYRDGSGR